MSDSYDLIVVGTGFASSFFLHRYLASAAPGARVLVLERGRLDSLAWQVEHRTNSSSSAEATFVNGTPEKDWVYTPSFGGGSSCWWACTPRMLPNDFETQSLYGVGTDWPMTYADLERFYTEAENLMTISGPDNTALFPRSAGYPQPPHHGTDPDRILAKAYPGLFFPMPTARARQGTMTRGQCCANGVCRICPVNAKFMIQHEMMHLYTDDRVTLTLEAEALALDLAGNRATGIHYRHNGAEHIANGDMIVLGANGLFNPFLLMQSGDSHPVLGRHLNEQVSVDVVVDLDGVESYQGSTSLTGHGYMLYDGAHRSERAACLLETSSIPEQVMGGMRTGRGKWQQRLKLKCIFENHALPENRVTVSDGPNPLPVTTFRAYSDQATRAVRDIRTLLGDALSPLPVEEITVSEPNGTEYHILSTHVMGTDPESSVTDRNLVHHRYRNLLVLGSGAFPTAAPANPTLTLSALSLWSAQQVLG